MTITGSSSSRLSDLKKYVTSGSFFDKYFLSNGSGSDGVNESLSTTSRVVYYVGEITYVDDIDSGGDVTTTFSFIGQGYDSPDFINVPIYKDPDKSNLVANPKIESDVFIVRQVLSAFDKNYKLNEINNLVELTSYAGGQFFNIVSEGNTQ
jgi:hypothetical protein